jgi:hypothetical protein
MTYLQLTADLLRAHSQPQQRTGSLIHLCRNRAGVTTRLRAFADKVTGSFGSAASTPGNATQLATDRELVSSKQLGNFGDVLLHFHRAVNRISFNLDEVFVIHRGTSTCVSGSLEC